MHIQTNFDRVYITAQSYTVAYVSLATWRVGSVMLDWSHYTMMKHNPVHQSAWPENMVSTLGYAIGRHNTPLLVHCHSGVAMTMTVFTIFNLHYSNTIYSETCPRHLFISYNWP